VKVRTAKRGLRGWGGKLRTVRWARKKMADGKDDNRRKKPDGNRRILQKRSIWGDRMKYSGGDKSAESEKHREEGA